MAEKKIDIIRLIATLIDAGVDFIIVGGVAENIYGHVPSLATLEIVYSRDLTNQERLVHVLEHLNCFYRMKPEVKPIASRLDSPDHHLLISKYGPLDLLGGIVGWGYPELISHTESLNLSVGRTVHILNLPTLIKIRQKMGREIDLAILPLLRDFLEETEMSEQETK